MTTQNGDKSRENQAAGQATGDQDSPTLKGRWAPKRENSTPPYFSTELTLAPVEGIKPAAVEWFAEGLLTALEHGPVESAELFRQARSCGISAKTLRRAGKGLGL